ncbi:DUF2442 domain-containing protein [bacterium]|nr:DUF2442 domain-containing protein [bacterium]
MKLETIGKSTLKAEVLSIDIHGIWLFVEGKEYFLPYEEFPWFKDAKIRDVLDVQLLHGFHLHWHALDVDLDINSLENKIEYPLIYK